VVDVQNVDVLVIGGGPAGCRAAIEASRHQPGGAVTLVERTTVVGGVCVNTGTIPSKTLREAVLHLTGYRQRGYYGPEYRLQRDVRQADLIARTHHVVQREIGVLRAQLARVGVDLVLGEAAFAGPHEVSVHGCHEGAEERCYRAGMIIVATGSESQRTAGFPYDGCNVIVPEELHALPELPRSMVIIGGGVIGSEYAAMYGLLGVRVVVVDGRPKPLAGVDGEIWEVLKSEMERNGVEFVLGREVASVAVRPEGGARVALSGGRTLEVDVVVTAAGRVGTAGRLDLGKVGLQADSRGRLKVDPAYRTSVPYIFAAGDVIGFPSLASAATEQGRIAACSAVGRTVCALPGLLPFGIYTIPEIGMLGPTQETLERKGAPVEVARASWSEVSRSHIAGDEVGLLKLMWHRETREILAVHIVGDGASELIHIGQAVMAQKGTIDYFIENVFNYPTMAQAYKIAVDGIR
jgi:NAD(P) transhydrogenase